MPAAVVKDGTVTPKFRQGKISPPFLTAKFSPRNSPLAKISHPRGSSYILLGICNRTRPVQLPVALKARFWSGHPHTQGRRAWALGSN